MFRKITLSCFIFVLVLAAWNYFSLQRHISTVIAEDYRNEGISVFLHYEYFVNPKVLVFDLRGVPGDKSPMDVSRVLIQLAQSLKENHYDRVLLAFKGKPRFMLLGSFFQTTGNEYGIQNPIYTLRNLPQNVYALDGANAFATWQGGLLGVVGKQMNDLNSFHEQWYMADIKKNYGVE